MQISSFNNIKCKKKKRNCRERLLSIEEEISFFLFHVYLYIENIAKKH